MRPINKKTLRWINGVRDYRGEKWYCKYVIMSYNVVALFYFYFYFACGCRRLCVCVCSDVQAKKKCSCLFYIVLLFRMATERSRDNNIWMHIQIQQKQEHEGEQERKRTWAKWWSLWNARQRQQYWPHIQCDCLNVRAMSVQTLTMHTHIHTCVAMYYDIPYKCE